MLERFLQNLLWITNTKNADIHIFDQPSISSSTDSKALFLHEICQHAVGGERNAVHALHRLSILVVVPECCLSLEILKKKKQINTSIRVWITLIDNCHHYHYLHKLVDFDLLGVSYICMALHADGLATAIDSDAFCR